MAKLPSPSSPSHWETGEAAGGCRRPWNPTSQATTAAGERVNGGGEPGGSIPPHDLSRGTVRWRRHGGQRVAGGGAVVVALWSVAAVGE